MAKAPANILGSFKNLGEATWGAAKRATTGLDGTSGIMGFAKRAVASVPDAGTWLMKSKAGPIVVAGAALAAIAGGVGLLRSGQQKRVYEDQLAMQDAMAQSMQPQQVSYKNSVNPYEAAMLDERMRAGGNGGSMGDKVMADRAALQAGTPAQ